MSWDWWRNISLQLILTASNNKVLLPVSMCKTGSRLTADTRARARAVTTALMQLYRLLLHAHSVATEATGFKPPHVIYVNSQHATTELFFFFFFLFLLFFLSSFSRVAVLHFVDSAVILSTTNTNYLCFQNVTEIFLVHLKRLFIRRKKTFKGWLTFYNCLINFIDVPA